MEKIDKAQVAGVTNDEILTEITSGVGVDLLLVILCRYMG